MKDFITEKDIHGHLAARMRERGVMFEEICITLKSGWSAEDVKKGTSGKVYVFEYEKEWVGKVFAEKEVSVYYKIVKGRMMLLTVKARYGSNFPKKEGTHEI